ncbi:hypothetical protein D8674_017959 [Pyrus ussuriensis x Pyrus communis]|uniref:Uncharacterized protein n=1 Tax=Pyrus ussuriensis x Pyrus communis TaxID=2448454 RepID=A0A5N5HE71_9ROSA|nr:hypothetical protein D8674_017959 [Pyrus ussuriensis x Pyrus communis]
MGWIRHCNYPSTLVGLVGAGGLGITCWVTWLVQTWAYGSLASGLECLGTWARCRVVCIISVFNSWHGCPRGLSYAKEATEGISPRAFWFWAFGRKAC